MQIVLQIVYTILVFGFLIFIHEFGHFITAIIFKVKVNEFSLGMGPAILEIEKPNKTKYALRALPIGGYVQMEGEDEDSNDPDAFNNKPAWQRFIIVAAGALMNIIFGFIFTVIIVCNAQLKSCVVSNFADNAPSQLSGLCVGDRLVKIDGHNINTYMDIQTAFSMSYGKDSMDITVIRDGQKVKLEDVKFTKSQIEDLTVLLQDFDLENEEKNFGNILKHSLLTPISFIKMTYGTLGDLVTRRISIKYVSGPVGTSEVIAQAASISFLSVIYLLALLSINLAVVNILPLPALDGGRLLFILIEMIARKPVPRKVEGVIHFVGIIVLFAFMILITFKDIWGLIFK